MITDEQAEWLLQEFKPLIGRTVMKEVADIYLQAESILQGTDSPRKIGCKCELGHLKSNTERMYNEFLQEYNKRTETLEDVLMNKLFM